MSADTNSVDVLAVLAFHARAQECTDYPRLRSFDELECARAAIAELIEAAILTRVAVEDDCVPNALIERLTAALSGVQGGAK